MIGKLSLSARTLALTLVFFALHAGTSGVAVSGTAAASSPPEAGAAAVLWLLLSSLLNTLVLVYLIRRAETRGIRLTIAVIVALFATMTLQAQIETLVFVQSIPTRTTLRLMAAGAVHAAILSPLAVLMLGKWRVQVTTPTERAETFRAGLSYRIILLAAGYVVVYFAFGYYIAWKSAAVRDFYGGSDPGSFFLQLQSIWSGTPWMFPFQFARGLLWVGIALLVVRTLPDRRWENALVVGLLFAVLLTSQLLLPNPFMPEAVRMAHLVETASSNFLFGMLTGYTLTVSHYREAKPVQASKTPHVTQAVS